MCNWTADVVIAMNKGDEAAATMERAHNKLLLAHIHKRFNRNTELHTRFKMRRDGQFGELLIRIEEKAKMATSCSILLCHDSEEGQMDVSMRHLLEKRAVSARLSG